MQNENLNSINEDKEFEITLRGMLAQDESRNTSENIQWGLADSELWMGLLFKGQGIVGSFHFSIHDYLSSSCEFDIQCKKSS
ncbi:MAG: hypothetical protein A2Y21_04415 [Clostridiales bacterium GWC2_40_7]|nr:MAG: hypothetical protein A2Y21_04415 [Clostridiales bacterium GWC2_40_7]